MSSVRFFGAATLALLFCVGCEDSVSDHPSESPWAAFSSQDYDSAESAWMAQLKDAQERGSTEDEATALCNLALVSQRRGEPDQAVQSLLRCIEQAEPGGQTWSIGIQRLAKLHMDGGEFQQAETVLMNAVDQLDGETPIDLAMRSFLLSKLGSLYYQQGNLEGSVDFYRQAIDAARGAEDYSVEAMAWGDLAWVYADQGRQDDAIGACEHRIRIVTRKDASLGEQVRQECQKLSSGLQ